MVSACEASAASSTCRAPAMRPASCSYGSRTSTSCASPRLSSSAAISGDSSRSVIVALWCRVAMKVGVVGHVEYVEFAVVDHVPKPGEIVHADETFSEAAGGGSVAAVQLAKLAGGSLFYTALGDEELGHRAKRELEDLQVDVRCEF